MPQLDPAALAALPITLPGDWITQGGAVGMLADVARHAGLDVAETPGWRDRGHGQMHAPRSLTLHHTAGAARGDAPSLGTVVDGRPDLPHKFGV